MAGNDFLNYCTYCGDRSICSVEFIASCEHCGIDSDDLLKVSHHLKYNDVMDELIKESNIERHYKLLHKQKYRDVITSLPMKCWCGKHIRFLWDCDTCFYDGEKSDTDDDAF